VNGAAQATTGRAELPPFRGPVVHVDPERAWSGGEVQVFLLMEGLRARSVPQVLVAPRGSAAERVARERGLDVVPIALRHSCDVVSVFRLRSLLRSASLVHLHTGRAAWLGAIAARLAGCPVVVTRRMDRAVRPGPRTNFIYRRTARAVIAISPAVRQCLLDGGVPAAAIDEIPDALDETRLLAPIGRAAMRRQLGLGDERFVVLALAQLMHRKGLDVLLRAVASLRDPRLCVLLAGDGPEAAALRALAAELQLGSAVQFLGRRNLLAACDLFVLPSRAEGLGVAALEALGAARPVIASKVGGLADLIQHERSGLHVPPDDPAALAAAIARLRDDPLLRERLAAAGPARVDEGFRVAQYVERHLAVYARVLAAAGR
jgi:glycosyltransferase involved in cell wall biosynthesis